MTHRRRPRLPRPHRVPALVSQRSMTVCIASMCYAAFPGSFTYYPTCGYSNPLLPIGFSRRPQ